MRVMIQPVLIYIFLCMLPMSLWAQKKASVFRAEKYYAGGEFDKAREEIDRVLQDPKKAKKAHVWSMRGKIYKASMLQKNAIMQEGEEEVWGVEAARSYAQVIDRQNEGSTLQVEALNAFNEIWAHFIAKGTRFYRKKDYKKAYQKFKAAVLVKPEDSVSLSYTGYMASQSKNYDEALVYYDKLIELGKAEEAIFSDAYYIRGTVQKDTVAAQELLEAAVQAYPNNKTFPKEQAKLLSDLGHERLAINKIREVVAKHPDDAQSYLNLAFIYDNRAIEKINNNDVMGALPYLDTAKLHYHKSVELDSMSLIANFNLGVVYINIARQYGDEARKMNFQEYQKRGKALEKKAQNIIRKSLPFLERAYRIQNDDYDVISALQQVYNELGMKAKAQEFKEKLNALDTKE